MTVRPVERIAVEILLKKKRKFLVIGSAQGLPNIPPPEIVVFKYQDNSGHWKIGKQKQGYDSGESQYI